jgi:hypothetical protein
LQDRLRTGERRLEYLAKKGKDRMLRTRSIKEGSIS